MNTTKKQLKQINMRIVDIQNQLDTQFTNPITNGLLSNFLPVFVLGTPMVAVGIFDNITVSPKSSATVNQEIGVTFKATDSSDKPIMQRTIVATIENNGSRAATIADKPKNTPGRKAVIQGNSLMITTDTKGEGIVYVFSNMAEVFNVKGVLTGAGLFSFPDASTTVTVS